MSTPRFPFGQPVRDVVQTDTTPKHVFVLGVYASAVHARWRGPDGTVKVRALAVASEPSIFWRGDGVEAILSAIDVPEAAGTLEAAAPQFNGPSGIALDERILAPLNLKRDDAWLCDLVPRSCVNPAQAKALARAYVPLVADGLVPEATVPPVPKMLADEARVAAILEELKASEATTLITLGDLPLRCFVARWGAKKRLGAYGREPGSYGRLHPITVDGRAMQLLPLAHPRQVARLGQSSKAWFDLHAHWSTEVAPTLSL